MYGMVNRAIEELISGDFGLPAWEAVKASAGIDVDVFISGEGYPDDVTYSLVAAASRHLSITPADFLRRFGVHWVTRTATRSYADLLASGGSSVKEFLCNLPHFHQRIGLLFPHLDPPEFRCADITNHSLRLHYFSRRVGLTHFVEGLLLGLGEHFQTPVKVSILAETSAGADHDEFLVEW
jgi:hypothetical protein